MIDTFDIKDRGYDYAGGYGLFCSKACAKRKDKEAADEAARKQAIIDALKEPAAAEGGMGLGTIIAIAVVALLVIGLILYFVLRKKK